ncbi:MAG: Hsp20/alpha crystallin family protein [Chloroflexi bacterium]|nr:Hsp20/alpha crystallin family protein [Chloroflexota bacterium]
MKLTRFQRPNLWPAFDPLTNLRDEINRLFDAPFGELTHSSEVFNVWGPALDLYEDKDHLIVKAELPGMKKEEIDISLHDGTLTIAGERKPEGKYADAEISRSERFFGRFQRTVNLPLLVESSKAKATYQDGILTVTLPKAEAAKPKQIEVKAS